ncbi:MerR family transcriptional regulator, partial [Proteocatella sphenisci]|uniref:MerR family transcriptional regulator n=1 Tax=Proteocatella sphenisci TaxID=181070 RepID=UPI00048ADA85
MKIGQFAKLNNTSIDTIRHYMSLGLLLPEKAGNQYEFDEKCMSDYLEIQRLKQIGFTLSEIQHLMLYKKMGNMTGYRQRMSYLSYFE